MTALDYTWKLIFRLFSTQYLSAQEKTNIFLHFKLSRPVINGKTRKQESARQSL